MNIDRIKEMQEKLEPLKNEYFHELEENIDVATFVPLAKNWIASVRKHNETSANTAQEMLNLFIRSINIKRPELLIITYGFLSSLMLDDMNFFINIVDHINKRNAKGREASLMKLLEEADK